MILRNFPLYNGRPRGAEQTENYVNALAFKRNVDELVDKVSYTNQKDSDLDAASDGVALNHHEIYSNALSYCDVKGVLSMGQDHEPDYMRLDIVPKRAGDRTYSYERRDDRVYYSRQLKNDNLVTHLVHDTATDTISMFVRDPQGRFPKTT